MLFRSVVVPKIEPPSTQEDLVFNNGIYIPKSSLVKTLPLSLARVWKKGNKIYLFDRHTTLIEKYIRSSLSNDTQVTYSVDASGVKTINFLDTTTSFIATKEYNSLTLSRTDINNDTKENLDKALSSTLVTSTSFNASESLANKTLKLKNLKSSIIQKYLQDNYIPYITEIITQAIPDKILNNNFFQIGRAHV